MASQFDDGVFSYHAADLCGESSYFLVSEQGRLSELFVTRLPGHDGYERGLMHQNKAQKTRNQSGFLH